MLQQVLLPPSAPPEPRSKRTEIWLLPSLRQRMREVAAEFDLSANEVLVQCLAHGLADELVVRLIERAAAHKRELAGSPAVEQNTPSAFLLPASLKLRLLELRQQHDLRVNEIVMVCLQHGLFDPLFLHRLKNLAAARTRKVGRTVRKEDLHRAA